MQKREYEKNYSTLFSNEPALLEIAGKIKKDIVEAIKRVLGDDHMVDIVDNEFNNFNITIDNNIKLLAIWLGSKKISVEPECDDELAKKTFGISDEEWQRSKASEEKFGNIPEITRRTYICKTELIISDDMEARFYQMAENILEAMKL